MSLGSFLWALGILVVPSGGKGQNNRSLRDRGMARVESR